jgi:deoxyribonuclease-1
LPLRGARSSLIHMRVRSVFLLVTVLACAQSAATSENGNTRIASFSEAKKFALKLHRENPVTIYCPCTYSGKVVNLKSCDYEIQNNPKRAARLEWEHVVPAEAFGQSFSEWRTGAPQCVKRKTGKAFKGRKCAETNPEFARMEADLYNLWPIIGELNGLRSNYSMEQISGPARTFGGCQAKIQNRKFEPMDLDKGIVARVYLYMDLNYPGRGVISDKNRKLFEAWDREHPVGPWECKRARLIQLHQGNTNSILASRCSANG